ncbi:MAG: NADH-quinone oxidoreductase subunit J [Chloroflexi bacterium]|nr:NADH-quinone oxidoreductase subunit J [Chloroflexota bacterium]
MLEIILFACFALAAIAGAIWVILGKNATWSALGLLVNFCALGALYIMLNAPFVALIQFIVYAGAIVVMFLFVIMFLMVARGEGEDRRLVQRYGGIALAVLLAVGLLYVGLNAAMPRAPLPATPQDNVQILGLMLFSQYLLPLWMAGVLFLIGMIAVVMLARRRREA